MSRRPVLFLSVAKCVVKHKSENLNCPKLLRIAKIKTTFRLKSGLYLSGGFNPDILFPQPDRVDFWEKEEQTIYSLLLRARYRQLRYCLLNSKQLQVFSLFSGIMSN